MAFRQNWEGSKLFYLVTKHNKSAESRIIGKIKTIATREK